MSKRLSIRGLTAAITAVVAFVSVGVILALAGRSFWGRRDLLLVALACIVAAAAIGFLFGGRQRRYLRSLEGVLWRVMRGQTEGLEAPRGPRELHEMVQRLMATAKEVDHSKCELEQRVRELQAELDARVNELRDANRLLLDIANRDALTGLANRRRLEIELERYAALARRHDFPISVIMLDLDRFKQYNDAAGHLAGDTLLRTVAQALKERARSTDLVVRWGGDEFCVLLPGADTRGAERVASSMLEAIGLAVREIPSAGLESLPGASAGIAGFPEHTEDWHSLVRLADQALYRAKEAGKGRVVCWSAPAEGAGD